MGGGSWGHYRWGRWVGSDVVGVPGRKGGMLGGQVVGVGRVG